MGEFDLIRAYFQPLNESVVQNTRKADHGLLLGIGDDCALLSCVAEPALAMSLDTLVEGVHFLAGTDAARLGHKALAVNLSDLAAMGAEPRWFMLGLTFPQTDTTWLAEFSRGLARLAHEAKILLIGGDTTRGPLAITLQVTGAVPPNRALRRDAAQVGDDVWVSGTLGLAGLGLAARQQAWAESEHTQAWFDRLEIPQPRLALGLALRGIAHACIDVSDGFLQDLAHILKASGVSARLDLDAIPVPVWEPLHLDLSATLFSQSALRDFCIRCGDDYELCFTAPFAQRAAIETLSKTLSLRLTRVGIIEAGAGLIDLQGVVLEARGYLHFHA
ncbi:Thiamine-monophosphate kinase [gamma proteobacterium HdN1]|nr:Thiamine-monophosphate kinase [gamma proteobacterium HdN1]